jgi:alpha-1,3-rhamnosyl/mannosyltransferase
MNVLLDMRVLPLSGAGVATRELVRALLSLPNAPRLTLLVHPAVQGHPEIAELTQGGADLRRFPYGMLTAGQHLPWLASHLRGAGLFHGTHFDVPWTAPSPLVVTIHDLFPLDIPGYTSAPKRAYFRAVCGRALRRAAAVIAVTQYTKDRVVSRFGVDAAKITPVWLAASDAYRPDAPPGEMGVLAREYALEPGYILYAGTTKRHKRVDLLLQVYQTVAAEMPSPPPLCLVGATQEQVLECAGPGGIPDGVRVLGRVPSAHLPMLFRNASVFCSMSSAEGFGLPNLEAMACGTPVVAAASGSVPEVVDDGGILTPSGDVAAAAEALMRVLSDEGLRAELRSRAVGRARLFNWRRTAEATLDVYRRALGGT